MKSTQFAKFSTRQNGLKLPKDDSKTLKRTEAQTLLDQCKRNGYLSGRHVDYSTPPLYFLKPKIPHRYSRDEVNVLYGYRRKLVCFDCHIAKKSSAHTVYTRKYGVVNVYWPVASADDPKCHSCGEIMSFVGPKFRAPSKRDSKEWKKAKDLYDSGCNFDYSFWEISDGPGTRAKG